MFDGYLFPGNYPQTQVNIRKLYAIMLAFSNNDNIDEACILGVFSICESDLSRSCYFHLLLFWYAPLAIPK